jgi:RNA polymerase sigma-70 factor (ECF subfamily)
MDAVCNSTVTNQLLERAVNRDQQALPVLLARHGERLRQMIRLRLDRRLRARFTSSTVLQQVAREAALRMDEYLANRSPSFFLWLRQLTGERIQALHQQHLGDAAPTAGQEVALYRGALPEANAASIAGRLLGQRAFSPSAQATMQIRLQDALNSMDPTDREILSLCNFEDLSNNEAAVVLGLDPGTTSHRYLRALKRLKEILNGIPGFFDGPQK